jgi:CheY-like chemotaxis protein
METIGRLAGGIAHEFNNLLAVILMRTELASGLLAPAAPLRRHLAEIDTAARRSAELTRQLLGFARRQVVAPKVLDLNATLAEMLPLLRKLVGNDIDLRCVADPLLWATRLDPVQVDQILVNLCLNARDAIDGSGHIVITTGNIIVEQSGTADPQAPPPGAYVMLTVRDDGCGMGPDVLDHLFEPFFTTKEVGKGTGLGLATVYGIVQQNQGHIHVDSAPGQGATFTIYLPRHSHSEVAPAVVSSQPLAHGQGETVLFVEDEETVLQMGVEALEFLGYRVLPAASVGEALQFAQSHGGSIDLLLTDIIMPTMNGQELAQRIAVFRPGIKQIFVSGYPADHISQRGILASGAPFLQKPFSLQELATQVQRTLATA